MHGAWHWFLHYTGTDENKLWYGWWSGFGGFTTLVLGFLAGMLANARKHNCHVKGCWRIGHHPVNGTPYVTCRKHHPDIDESETCTIDVVKAAYERGNPKP